MPLTAKEIFCLAVWYASFRSKLIAVEIGFNAITEASPKKIAYSAAVISMYAMSGRFALFLIHLSIISLLQCY